MQLITLTDPRSAAAEAYQSLRTNLEFSGLDLPIRSLLVTSVDSETDKSKALANLAVVLAEAGDRVIVIDGDLRRPQQHEIFELSNAEGLTDWLKGKALTLQESTVPNLRILTSGPLPPNPVALLSTRRLADLLETLEKEVDYILCDAPPVLAVTDAALWASRTDGVLLVINAGRTKREQARRAKDVLEKVHARLLGAVLLNAEEEVVVSGGYGRK